MLPSYCLFIALPGAHMPSLISVWSTAMSALYPLPLVALNTTCNFNHLYLVRDHFMEVITRIIILNPSKIIT